MIIRVAEEKDAPILSQLLGQLGYPASTDESLKRIQLYQQDGYRLMMGEVGDQCIGFIALPWYHALHHPRPIGRVGAFCVDESYRRKGWGSQLLEYAEDFFRSNSCVKVELTSNLKGKGRHDDFCLKMCQRACLQFV